MTGQWPTAEIDHINGVKSDNRWRNLRDVSKSTNQHNRRGARCDSQSKRLGVVQVGENKWRAVIHVDRRQRHLGYFESADAAELAYTQAKHSAVDMPG